MDPCLKQHQSGATDLISLGKVFSFPPAEEKTLVEVAEKAGTLTICMDFLEDWCKLLIFSHACLWCFNLLCVFLMFFLPPKNPKPPREKNPGFPAWKSTQQPKKTHRFEAPLPEVKFEGAGDNKGLCCSFENGVCGLRSGSVFAELGFFFFQSKCSKIQKGDFFWTFPLGRVEEIRNHAIAEGFLGAFGRFRRHRNHGSQALKRRSLRNH